MKRPILISSVVAAALMAVSGCFESKTIVTVEKDGSGTVEQTVYYKEMDFGSGGFEVSFGEENGDFDFGQAESEEIQFPQPKKMSDEEKLAATRAQAEKTAAGMGEGVSVKSVEALPPKNGRKGVRIVYAFADIDKLRIDSLPEVDLGGGTRIGSPGGAMGAGDFSASEFGDAPTAPADRKEDKIRFEFKEGATPSLTILIPEMTPPAGAGPPADEDPQAQAMAKMMMTQMFDGMLMEFRVRVNGNITKTNATYSKPGSSDVGLYRMDFDSLVENPAAVDKLLKLDASADADRAKKQLEDPDLARHLKIEMQDRIEVAFE